MPHWSLTLLLTAMLSAVMALLGERPLRQRLCVAAYVFLGCVVSTIAGSWAMFWIHG